MPEEEDSLLASDTGVDDGGGAVGLMSTHVDDLLLVADDRTREMVGRVLDFRFNQLKRRSSITGVSLRPRI